MWRRGVASGSLPFPSDLEPVVVSVLGVVAPPVPVGPALGWIDRCCKSLQINANGSIDRSIDRLIDRSIDR